MTNTNRNFFFEKGFYSIFAKLPTINNFLTTVVMAANTHMATVALDNSYVLFRTRNLGQHFFDISKKMM
jgi:hypothetical protein